MTEEIKMIKKSTNCVDEYSDSFGYASFGDDEFGYMASISFFKHVNEWPEDGSNNTLPIKYNMATIRMPENLALKLADFIYSQHRARKQEDNG